MTKFLTQVNYKILFLTRLPPNPWTLIPEREAHFTFIRKEDLGPLANSPVLLLLGPVETLETLRHFPWYSNFLERVCICENCGSGSTAEQVQVSSTGTCMVEERILHHLTWKKISSWKSAKFRMTSHFNVDCSTYVSNPKDSLMEITNQIQF